MLNINKLSQQHTANQDGATQMSKTDQEIIQSKAKNMPIQLIYKIFFTYQYVTLFFNVFFSNFKS